MAVLANNILEQVTSSPLFPELLEELFQRYETEKTLRQEFYENISSEQKCEFINGEVIMHSSEPAKNLRATIRLVTIMSAYVRTQRLGEVFMEKALCCFPRNDYQPDIVFFGLDK